MAEPKTVAIGIQSFDKIIEGNYFYIDKTDWIFLCDEIALPEIWKSDVRKVEII